jgi:hypothetical protein
MNVSVAERRLKDPGGFTKGNREKLSLDAQRFDLRRSKGSTLILIDRQIWAGQNSSVAPRRSFLVELAPRDGIPRLPSMVAPRPLCFLLLGFRKSQERTRQGYAPRPRLYESLCRS